MKPKAMNSLKQKIDSAIKAVVNYRTTPIQIDYTSPKQLAEYHEACELLNNLPRGLKDKYFRIIVKQVDEYYEPHLCDDGNYYSAADLDNMF